MTTKRRIQHENLHSEKIKDILILLRGDFALSNREIALQLGVGENYLSNVFNGGKAGSAQLLAGLELLKEVIELRAALALAKTPMGTKLDELQRQLDELRRNTSIPYPEHRPQNLAINEREDKPVSSGTADQVALKAAQIAVDDARKRKGEGPAE